jgi:hypothetical protein
MQAAELVHRELPVRIVSRIHHIENIPKWEQVPQLLELHSILCDSFADLNALQAVTNVKQFNEVMHKLPMRRRRWDTATAGLIDAVSCHLENEHEVEAAFADEWMHTFLRCQTGTEMITQHYMRVAVENAIGRGRSEGPVYRKCNPVQMCQRAADRVKREARYSGVPIYVADSVSDHSQDFSFVPEYLLFMVKEMIKSSAQDIIISRKTNKSLLDESVHVTCSTDHDEVTINTFLKSGGEYAGTEDKIWSHPFSKFGAASDNELNNSKQGPTMSDRLGMYLSRSYARFLGGSLERSVLPGVGMNTFLKVNRLNAGAVEI